MSHIPPEGYEDVGFFGRNCHSCLRPEDGTPYEAACKCAERFEGSYIIEEEDGWTVYAPSIDNVLSDEQLSIEDRLVLERWLNTPLEEHIARWQSEMDTGLRDKEGRWIGGDRRRRRMREDGSGQSE